MKSPVHLYTTGTLYIYIIWNQSIRDYHHDCAGTDRRGRHSGGDDGRPFPSRFRSLVRRLCLVPSISAVWNLVVWRRWFRSGPARFRGGTGLARGFETPDLRRLLLDARPHLFSSLAIPLLLLASVRSTHPTRRLHDVDLPRFVRLWRQAHGRDKRHGQEDRLQGWQLGPGL